MMQRFWILCIAIMLACLQLALHGLSQSAVIPNIALVGLVIASSYFEFSQIIWFVLPLGLILELGSGAPYGTQLLMLLLFVLATKLILRATEGQTRAGFLLALTLTATIAINFVLVLTLPTSVLISSWRFWLVRSLLEAMYNGLILGVWFGLVTSRRSKPSGYKLPSG